MAPTRSRRKIGLFAAAGIVVGLALFVRLTWPRERDLIPVAHRILALDRARLRDETPRENAYWLSNDQILIVTTDQDAEPMGKTGVDDWQGHADLLILPACNRTRLIGLTRLLNRLGVTPMGAPIRFELSPKGTRLSWLNHQHLDRLSYGTATAKLDGSAYRECQWLEADTFWIDDRHFVETLPSGNAKIPQMHVLDLQNSAGDCDYAAGSKQAQAVLQQYLHSLPPERVNVYAPDGVSYTIRIDRLRDGETMPGASRRYALRLPRGAEVLHTSTPQNNSAILFRLRFATVSPLLAWAHRLLPAIPAKPAITEGLWISRPDGTGMREIGHVPGSAEQENLEDVQWLPGGKWVGFVYRGTLYVVPAEPPK